MESSERAKTPETPQKDHHYILEIFPDEGEVFIEGPQPPEETVGNIHAYLEFRHILLQSLSQYTTVQNLDHLKGDTSIRINDKKITSIQKGRDLNWQYVAIHELNKSILSSNGESIEILIPDVPAAELGNIVQPGEINNVYDLYIALQDFLHEGLRALQEDLNPYGISLLWTPLQILVPKSLNAKDPLKFKITVIPAFEEWPNV